MTPLSKLKKRNLAKVIGFSCDEEKESLLLSLGFTPGSIISLVSKVAFGGPLAIKVKGSTIAIRQADAQSILVQPI